MTFPQVYDLLEYWQYNPPLHVMIKAYLGIKTEKPARTQNQKQQKESENYDGLCELFGMLGGQVIHAKRDGASHG